MNVNTKMSTSKSSLVSEIRNQGMSCNLTDILINDLGFNIDSRSRKQNRNSVFPCEKWG